MQIDLLPAASAVGRLIDGFNDPIVFDSKLFFGGTPSFVFSTDGTTLSSFYLSQTDYDHGFSDAVEFSGKLYFRGYTKYGVAKLYIHETQ